MASPTVAFGELCARKATGNPNFINLGGGDVSTSCPPGVVRDGALAHLSRPDPREPYPRVGGDTSKGGLVEAYRHFLWRQTGMGFKNSQVLVTPGAKQAFHLGVLALAKDYPGSCVLILKPAWPTFEERVQAAGLTPIIIDCNSDGSVNLTQLTHATSTYGTRIKGCIINNPRNPDGYVYSRNELEQIVTIVLGSCPDCIFLADEVYQLNLYEGETFVPLSTVLPPGARHLSFFSVSKAFASAGFRLGFGSGDEQLINWMTEEASSTTGGVATVCQRAALGALSEEGLQFPGRLMATLQVYRDRVVAWASDTRFRVRIPRSTIYCCLDASDLIGRTVPSMRFATACDIAMFGVNHYDVAAMFGDPFGDPNMLRLNLAQVRDMDHLDEALRRLNALALAAD